MLNLPATTSSEGRGREAGIREDDHHRALHVQNLLCRRLNHSLFLTTYPQHGLVSVLTFKRFACDCGLCDEIYAREVFAHTELQTMC